MSIPTHLISGFLGAGKTTTLLHLLRELKARGERCAVLVNEFGALGVDGAVLAEAPSLAVKEIADGCICCTLAGRLAEGLLELADRVRPERVFIEPTGLARPEELRRLLAQEELANRFTLRPVLTVVDPLTFLKLRGRKMGFYDAQVAEAGVIVANKLDRVGPESLADFRTALAAANPGARMIETQFGRVPLDVLESMPQPVSKAANAAQNHAHAPGEALSIQFDSEASFDAKRLREVFATLAEGMLGVEAWRAKGIFRTPEGWLLLQLSASGVDASMLQSNQAGSRCDVLAEYIPADARNRMEAALENCVMKGSKRS